MAKWGAILPQLPRRAMNSHDALAARPFARTLPLPMRCHLMPNNATTLAARAAEYRANAQASLRDMQATSLPELREKHRAAAERWLRLTQTVEAQIRRAEGAAEPS